MSKMELRTSKEESRREILSSLKFCFKINAKAGS